MPRQKRERWRAVKAAQSYLAGESLAIVKSLVKAAKSGDTKAGMWLLEHTATADIDGKEIRPIAPTADLTKVPGVGEGGNAPRILIGVSLGADFAQLNNTPTRPAIAPSMSQSVSLPAVPANFLSVIEGEHVMSSQTVDEPSV